jgi:hypothetical protein
MKKTLSTIIVVALMLVFARVGFAQDKPTEPVQKMYLVYFSDDKDAAYELVNLEVVDFNGIKCLKGKQVDISWVKNTIVYVPVDKIKSVVEYESFQKYKDALDEYSKKRMQ